MLPQRCFDYACGFAQHDILLSLYPKFLKGRGAGKGNFFQKVFLPRYSVPQKRPENYSIKAVSLPVGSKVSSLCTKYSVMSKFFGRSVGV